MSLAINPKIDGTLELKNNDTAKTLMTFDSQGRQTNPNGLSYVGGSTLVDGLSAVFTNSNNNINATGIGVGVEVGDVIQIIDSANNSGEFTVEVITDADNVIVNQAHAGGTTSKSLVNETTTVTVKLLCKWYLASAGLGRSNINLTTARAVGVDYVNSSGREMPVSISISQVTTTSDTSSFLVDGVEQAESSQDGGALARTNNTMTLNVPSGSTYRITSALGGITVWSELR